MPTLWTFSDVTVTNPVMVIPPAIPGLEIWSVFGTDALAAAGNLVVGGPTMTAMGAGPSQQAGNYAIFNAGGALGGLDTGIQRTTGLMASGWSMMWGCSVSNNATPAAMVSDGFTGQFFVANMNNNTILNGPGLVIDINGVQPPDQQIATGNQTTMKVYGVTWGGQGTPVNAYGLTDGTSGSTYNVTMAASTNTLKLGFYQVNQYCTPIKCSFFMFATGLLSLSAMQAIYASAKSLLKQRAFTTV